jgi:quinol monooxygenase YgiN
MDKVSVVARVTAAAGHEEAVRARLAEAVRAVADEHGTEVYSVHRDASDPTVFWMFEVYASREAVDAHRVSDAMRSLVADMKDLAEGRGEVHVLRPVAAKGLDL